MQSNGQGCIINKSRLEMFTVIDMSRLWMYTIEQSQVRGAHNQKFKVRDV